MEKLGVNSSKRGSLQASLASAVIFLAAGVLCAKAGDTAVGDITYRDGAALRAAAVSPDEMSIAIRTLERAAAFGNTSSLIALGDIYGNGEHAALDEVRAKAFYDLAALDGLEREALRGIATLFRSSEGALHDAAEALNYYRRASALGDGSSLAALTEMYATGEGVTADEATARFYFTKAIEAGNAVDVLPKLAKLLRTPKGALYDPAEAVRLFEQAVALGHSRSLIALGEMYAAGEGVEADEAKAWRYFERASSQGLEKDASRRLAALFRSQDGNLHDPAEAGVLYQRAAELGDIRSLLALGKMLAAGEGFRADEIKARDYFQQAAAAGLEREATRELATLYLSSEGKLHDTKQAMRLLERAASLGDARSLLDLGDIYAAGSDVEADEAKAQAYYDRAAQAGLTKEGVGRVAALYWSPEGGLYDLAQASRLFEQAAALGDVRAVMSLGRLYAEGAGVGFDEVKAEALFELAAGKGFESEAYRRLAGLYRSPEGELHDVGEALRLFEQAASMGDVGSMTALGEMYASGETLGNVTKKATGDQAEGTH